MFQSGSRSFDLPQKMEGFRRRQNDAGSRGDLAGVVSQLSASDQRSMSAKQSFDHAAKHSLTTSNNKQRADHRSRVQSATGSPRPKQSGSNDSGTDVAARRRETVIRRTQGHGDDSERSHGFSRRDQRPPHSFHSLSFQASERVAAQFASIWHGTSHSPPSGQSPSVRRGEHRHGRGWRCCA